MSAADAKLEQKIKGIIYPDQYGLRRIGISRRQRRSDDRRRAGRVS
jgi:hypothetical protein